MLSYLLTPNESGEQGTKLRVGMAYTNWTLNVKVNKDKWGEYNVEVVSTLGIEGSKDVDFKEGCRIFVE